MQKLGLTCIFIFVYLAIFVSVLALSSPDTGPQVATIPVAPVASVQSTQVKVGVCWSLFMGGYKALQFLEINFGAERKHGKTHSFLKRWASKKHHNGTWQWDPCHPIQVTRAQTSQGVFREALKSFFFFCWDQPDPLGCKMSTVFFFGGGGRL